ncbi:MAG: hypothetical protein Pars2KO_28750 [Parasphingorhabdus sp.]
MVRTSVSGLNQTSTFEARKDAQRAIGEDIPFTSYAQDFINLTVSIAFMADMTALSERMKHALLSF